jgi:hemoglobin
MFAQTLPGVYVPSFMRDNVSVTQPIETTPLRTPLYDRIGPAKLRAIIQAFYPLVKQEPLIAGLFPEDLSETMNKQEAFMTGFLGGPPLYHRYYGPPMLRDRHLKFSITPERAHAWFACFTDATNTVALEPEVRDELLQAVARMAAHMVNTPTETPDPSHSSQ